MIQSMEIENFKCIGKNTKIDIKPVTILMGPNSSGKSSIIKPLLLAKQTADSRDVQMTVQSDGNYVSLGPFKDFVYRHDKKRKVKFSFHYEPEQGLPWRMLKRRIGESSIYSVSSKRSEVNLKVTLRSGPQDQIINEGTAFNLSSALGEITVA